MFAFDQFAQLNRWLGGFWRLIALNLLWIAVTLLGLVVVGIGPASYALAKYLDRWFRHGETPAMVPAFWRYAREQGLRPVAMAAILQAAAVVIAVNLMSLTDWYLRAANLGALVLLAVIGSYVFFVMAATEVRGMRRQLSGALLLGVGSLHWTVLGATAVGLSCWLMTRFAVPLLLLLVPVLPFAVVAAILRSVLRDLDEAVAVAHAASADAASAAAGAPASLTAPAVGPAVVPSPLTRLRLRRSPS
ncbi:YesL family protein [Brachybacterium sp. DNPG3]